MPEYLTKESKMKFLNPKVYLYNFSSEYHAMRMRNIWLSYIALYVPHIFVLIVQRELMLQKHYINIKESHYQVNQLI